MIGIYLVIMECECGGVAYRCFIRKPSPEALEQFAAQKRAKGHEVMNLYGMKIGLQWSLK